MLKSDEIIEMISPEEILAFLADTYGMHPHTNRGNEARFYTDCHKGDSTSLVFYKDSKRFYCYTNCGSMSLFDLVMHLKSKESWDFHRARHFVMNSFGIDEYEDEYEDNLSASAPSVPIVQEPVVVPVLTEHPSKVLDSTEWFQKQYHDSWCRAGISIKTMRDFDIRWVGCYNHIVIPHRDRDGRLVGIRRRALLPDEPKYMPVRGFEHHTGANLYGIDHFVRLEGDKSSVFVAEGEKSVLQAHSFPSGNYKQVLAVCGSNVSPIQMEIMKQAGVKTVCLAFDNDAVGFARKEEWQEDSILYYRKLLVVCAKLQPHFHVEVICDRQNRLEPKDSPFDQGEEIFRKLVEEKFELEEFKEIVEGAFTKWKMQKR